MEVPQYINGHFSECPMKSMHVSYIMVSIPIDSSNILAYLAYSSLHIF